MTFDEYQQKARKTAKYPGAGSGKFPPYLVMGLTGESGEIADKVKKAIRDDGSIITAERRDLLKKELGDVLWYISQMASELGFSLDDVAETNIEKLYSRFDRGAIGGDGDNR